MSNIDIFFVVIILTGFNMSAGVPRNACEKITVPMCRGIGYNYTKLPNVFGHRDQEVVALDVYQFWPLVAIGCSSSLNKFLCSVYVPMCNESGATGLPCRSLCEKSRKGCEPLMKKFGFPWPKELDCMNFPIKDGVHACIDQSNVTIGNFTHIIRNETAGIPRPPCQKITSPMCRGIGYDHKKSPNVFNHSSEAEFAVHQFLPITEVGCSTLLKTFVCSVYLPMCTVINGTDSPVPPCRSLCEISRKGCEILMKRFGFPWPTNFDCLSFPVKSGGQACVGPKCGKNLTSIQGVFSPPSYMSYYPKGTECNWIIHLPDSYEAVKITIEKMRLKDEPNCLYDYIIIKDKMLNQVGPRHCGTYRSPYQVPVRGNKAIITFVSDGSTNKAGFVIK